MEKKCENCSRYQNNWCQSRFKCQNYIYFKPKLQTNRQWLESLSNEELASYYAKTGKCSECNFISNCVKHSYENCYGMFLKWLQAEHKE